MNKQTFRGIISLIIFLLGAAVTLPLATGVFIDRLKPENPPSDLTEDTDAPFTLPPVPTGIAQTTSEPPVETTSPELTTGTSTDDSSVVSEPVTSEPPETTAEITTAEITTEAVTTAEETTSDSSKIYYYGSEYPWVTVDKSYFSDALFIGDSRTVGIQLFTAGKLDNAVFFCTEGMSAIGALGGSFEVKYGANASGYSKSLGKMTLSQLLDSMYFGKIYIMLGVNELGGNIPSIGTYLGQLKDLALTKNPGTKVIMEGNLHFSTAAEQSYIKKRWNYMCNANINRVNTMMAGMTDWTNVFYIDVNELFDLPDGTFDPKRSGGDGVHPNSAGYRDWADWIYTRGIPG